MITNIFCSSVQKMPKINNTIKNNKTKINNTKNNPWLLIWLFIPLGLSGLFVINNYYIDRAKNQIKELESKLRASEKNVAEQKTQIAELRNSNVMVEGVDVKDIVSTLEFKKREIEHLQNVNQNVVNENRELVNQTGQLTLKYQQLIAPIPTDVQQQVHNKYFVNSDDGKKQYNNLLPSFAHFRALPIPATTEEDKRKELQKQKDAATKIFQVFTQTCENGKETIEQLENTLNESIENVNKAQGIYNQKTEQLQERINKNQEEEEKYKELQDELNKKIEENNKINQKLKKIKTSKQKMKEFLGNDEHNFNETQSYNSNAF